MRFCSAIALFHGTLPHPAIALHPAIPLSPAIARPPAIARNPAMPLSLSNAHLPAIGIAYAIAFDSQPCHRPSSCCRPFGCRYPRWCTRPPQPPSDAAAVTAPRGTGASWRLFSIPKRSRRSKHRDGRIKGLLLQHSRGRAGKGKA